MTDLLQSAQEGTAQDHIQYEGWINESQVKQFIAEFAYDENQERYAAAATGEALVFRIRDKKAADEIRYAILSIDGISQEQYNTINTALKNQKLYTIEEIYVADRATRLTAVDPKS